jgi:hypothetical protein
LDLANIAGPFIARERLPTLTFFFPGPRTRSGANYSAIHRARKDGPPLTEPFFSCSVAIAFFVFVFFRFFVFVFLFWFFRGGVGFRLSGPSRPSGVFGPGLGVFVMLSVASSPVCIARSAFRAGSLRGLLLRPSRRSFSGAVLVCWFGCPRRAGRFAARWAGRLGVSVVVRCSAGQWQVAVPVRRGSSRWPQCVGLRLPVRGGLRGFRQALGWSGLGVCRG